MPGGNAPGEKDRVGKDQGGKVLESLGDQSGTPKSMINRTKPISDMQLIRVSPASTFHCPWS